MSSQNPAHLGVIARFKSSAHLRRSLFRLAILSGFVAFLWIVQVYNWLTGYGLNTALGLIPRHVRGLDGIFAMPLLHASFPHLISNTPPLIAIGAMLAITTRRSLLLINGVIVILGGALVWLMGSTAIHVGASGLIFGWLGFLIARGLLDKSIVPLLAAAVIGFFYGSILWGVIPGQVGVSWESHLYGVICGIVAAMVVRKPLKQSAPAEQSRS